MRFTGHSRIVDLQYEIYFIAPFWHIEFGGGSQVFGKFVDSCHTITSFCKIGRNGFKFILLKNTAPHVNAVRPLTSNHCVTLYVWLTTRYFCSSTIGLTGRVTCATEINPSIINRFMHVYTVYRTTGTDTSSSVIATSSLVAKPDVSPQLIPTPATSRAHTTCLSLILKLSFRHFLFHVTVFRHHTTIL